MMGWGYQLWSDRVKLTHTSSWNWDNVCLASDMTNSSVPENFPPPAFAYQPEPLWKLNDLIQVQTRLWVRRHEWTPLVTASLFMYSPLVLPFAHISTSILPLQRLSLCSSPESIWQLIGSMSEFRLIITNLFKLNSDRSSWSFTQFAKSRHKQ